MSRSSLINMLKVKQFCFFIIIILNLNCISFVSTDILNVVYRQLWNATTISEDIPKADKLLKKVVVHDTGGPTCNDLESCSAIVRKLQEDDIPTRGDLRYNFLVGGDGSTYEGRGWYQVGASVDGFDHLCISIAFIGNFRDLFPKKSAWAAFQSLLADGVEYKYIAPDYDVMAHRQYYDDREDFAKNSINCPGRNLYNLLKTMPQWANLTVTLNYHY